MAVNLSFIGGAGWQFFDDNGKPLSGGKIFTYEAGTTTPLATYTSRSGSTPNTNPVILDAAGRTPEQIWATEGVLYKYVVKTSTDVLVRTWDNIGGSVVASSLQQDLANTTDPTKGDALIGFKQSNSSGFIHGAVARTVNDKLQEFVSVKDFGAVGDGVADDTAAIQAALDSFTGYFGTVLLPSNGTYRITAPLVLVRGHNLVGDGSPEIVADFSGPNWAGDYVALKFIVESVTSIQLQEGFGQKSYGFRLTGANNAGVISYGMRFYTSVTIAVTQAVNYSYLWGTIENINIRRFDTGIWMQECWNSFFNNVVITYCRRGLFVQGKSVNVTFVGLQVTNPTLDNTSSTADTIGIDLRSGFHYSGGVEGRPEGFSFIGGLIFGFVNNVKITNFLKVTFTSVIIDGASGDCVSIISPHLTTFKDCYLFTVGNGKACIAFSPVAVGTSSSTIIDGCEMIGYDGTQNGVSFVAGGALRQDITIINNTGTSLNRLVSAEAVPINSHIVLNHVEFHAGTEMIYLQTGGEGTIVDGNTCSTTSVFPVRCHPTTSAKLQIGVNTSPTFTTRFVGQVTIPAGNTTALLPNNMYTSTDLYMRPITHATPNGNAGSWYIQESVSQSTSRITLGTALGADLVVRYTTTAIPYAATI